MPLTFFSSAASEGGPDRQHHSDALHQKTRLLPPSLCVRKPLPFGNGQLQTTCPCRLSISLDLENITADVLSRSGELIMNEWSTQQDYTPFLHNGVSPQ